MNNIYDVICVGAALVDSLIKGFDPHPVSASGYRAVSGTLSVGGEAVNTSMAAAKLGLRTGILCALGEDEAGNMVESALRRAGVDTSLIVRSGEHATPVTTMFVRDDGTRQSITNTAHRYNFHPENYAGRLAGAKALVLGSLFRAPFDDPAVIRDMLESAKAHGQTVFADTKLPNFNFLTLADIADSLPLIDCITPNEDEARHFTGKDTPEEAARVFLASGVRNVIVKLGGRGCYFKNETTELSLPAPDVTAVDATGAGDNFLAGFVSEILRGASWPEALRFASACGAVACTRVGAGTALKSREQVLEMMINYYSRPATARARSSRCSPATGQ